MLGLVVNIMVHRIGSLSMPLVISPAGFTIKVVLNKNPSVCQANPNRHNNEFDKLIIGLTWSLYFFSMVTTAYRALPIQQFD